jgi:hypothetical protein
MTGGNAFFPSKNADCSRFAREILMQLDTHTKLNSIVQRTSQHRPPTLPCGFAVTDSRGFEFESHRLLRYRRCSDSSTRAAVEGIGAKTLLSDRQS